MKKKKSMKDRVLKIVVLSILRKKLAEKEGQRAEKRLAMGKVRRQISAKVPAPETMLYLAMGGKPSRITSVSKAAAARAAANAGLAATARKSGGGMGKLVAGIAVRELTKPVGSKKKKAFR